MTDYPWQRLEELFHGALDHPPAQQQAWLEKQAPTEPELVEEVLRLLAGHDTGPDRLEQSIADTARNLSDDMAPAACRRLGAYRVIRQLGQGGMGTVYLAERDDAEYQQQVAIKLIRGFPGDQALRRLRQERQILADLNHPNIARLLDGGTTGDGQPFLVMQYIDGVPIVQWCRDQALSQRDRVALMLQVCDAVRYAHQHLVIHRDIKPGNVLVTEDGRPMLLDFGIAKLITEPDAAASQTVRFYTPGYASPEQLAGQPITTASDVYGLGRLLLALLHRDDGHPETDAREQVLRRAAWTRELGAPRDLTAIIEQATRAEPERRYATVAALRADLVNYLEGRAVGAVPDRLGYRLGKFINRHRAATSAGMIVVLTGLALVWQLLVEYDRTRVAEARAQIEATHSRQVLDFLLSTIGAASPQQARGQDVTVREVVERGYQAILADPDLEPALQGRLLLALGEVYQNLESHDAAAELFRRAAESGEPATRVRALSRLGYGHILQRQPDQAHPPLELAMSLAASHTDLPVKTRLELQNHFGLWQLETGKPTLARDAFAEIAAAHLDLGAREEAARIIHNQALAERQLGNLDQAAGLFRQSLAMKAETVGTTDPSYAHGLKHLAQVLSRLGDFTGARNAVHESMALRKKLFGENHPGLHADYNELASAYHDLGDYPRAIELYEQALTLHAQAGDPPILSASYINNLASAFEDRGDWEGASRRFRESLALRRAELGDDHASVALARHNLARNLMRLGQFEEAETLLRAALSARASLLGENHQATIYTGGLWGSLAHLQGRSEEAVPIFRQTLEGLTEHVPETNLWVLSTRSELARSLLAAGEMAEAETLLARTVLHYHQALSEEHPHAAALELDLARIELMQGMHGPAARRIQKITPVLESRMHPESAALRQLNCLQAGKTDEACWHLVQRAELPGH